MHILLVDDDPLAAEMIQVTLEAFDHQVTLAEHALAAIDVWQSVKDIDLIVSDMNMPIMNGIELYQTLKEQGSKLPFMLLTGDDPQPLLRQEPGLAACLLKDFNLDETLPKVIEQIMSSLQGAAS